MAQNRYANLVGSNKISEEWHKINDGFQAVEEDVDEVNQNLDEHIDDEDIHTTAAEKQAWNSKADGALEQTVDDHIGSRGNAHANATQTESGFMSAADKTKLNQIEDGAEKNQNAFAKVNDLEADSPTDQLILKGGTGITVSTNPNTNEVEFTATGEATPGPHAASHALGGSDPVTLDKSQVGLGSVDNVKQATKQEFDDHVADDENPHGVTKSQVGLGNVPNYGAATQAQAEAGTANNVLMTPQRTKQAIDANVESIRTDSTEAFRTEVVSSLPTGQKGRIVLLDDPNEPAFKGFTGGEWV